MVKDNAGKTQSKKEEVLRPKAVPSLKRKKCVEIKCGSSHSYVLTQEGQHILFGSNDHNQVTLFASAKNAVGARLINSFPYRQGQSRIVDVYSGKDSTCIKYHNLEVSCVCALCPLCQRISNTNAEIQNEAERERMAAQREREAQRQDVGDRNGTREERRPVQARREAT